MQVTGRIHQIGLALFRVLVGVIFLWAGIEKFTGAEPFSAAGFLKFGTLGTLGWPFVTGTPAEGTVFNPTHDIWVSLAGNATADREYPIPLLDGSANVRHASTQG